jgi:hypothetical protein
VEARPAELREVWHEAESRAGKWPSLMMAGLAEIDPTVRDRTLAAVGRTRSAVPGLDLTFEQGPPRDDLEREAVALWANAGEQRIRCLVSREVLEDHYGADGLGREGRVQRVRDNRRELEALLREKYLRDPIEGSGLIVLRTLDVERLRGEIAVAPTRRASRKP